MSATATAQPTNELPSHAPDPAFPSVLATVVASADAVGASSAAWAAATAATAVTTLSFSSSCCFLWLMIRSTTLLPSSLGTLCSPLT